MITGCKGLRSATELRPHRDCVNPRDGDRRVATRLGHQFVAFAYRLMGSIVTDAWIHD
jgi:hypothetical protein